MKFFVAYLCVFAGGSVGALSRFGIQEACRKWTPLPGWGAIFIANMLGCLAIGFTVAWLQGLQAEFHLDPISPLRRYIETQETRQGIALLAVGFCGAFTTFSTFSLDNHFLYRSHRGQMSFNMVAQVVVGLAAVSAGWYAGQWVAA